MHCFGALWPRERLHVQSLNLIDVTFDSVDKESKSVREAWKAYLDHLNTPMQGEAWGTRREDLLVDLLYTMSNVLGYDFDKTHIRRTSYFPRGYGEIELDQATIRRGLARVMEGNAAFPVIVYYPVPTPEISQQEAEAVTHPSRPQT
jgi:hypothetical protein